MSGWFAVALPVLLAADAEAKAPPVPPAEAGAAPAPGRPCFARPPTGATRNVRRIDLEPAKDGSGDLLYEATSFSARIAPDGTVTFKDKRITDFSCSPTCSEAHPAGRPVAAVVNGDVSQGKGAAGGAALRAGPGPAATGDDQADPRHLTLPARSARGLPQLPSFDTCNSTPPAGGIDRRDRSLLGQGPEPLSEGDVPGGDRDRRTEMAVKALAVNIRRAAAELPARLQAVACDERLPHGERRRDPRRAGARDGRRHARGHDRGGRDHGVPRPFRRGRRHLRQGAVTVTTEPRPAAPCA